jgi:hypothetical protein
VSDWRWNNRTPPFSSFSSFLTASPLQVAARQRWIGLSTAWKVELYSKDGLRFPPLAELQTLEQAMLSQDMERLKPMLTVLTAGSDIAGSSIASSKGRTEQVYRLPQGRSYSGNPYWKNASFDLDDGMWNWKDHVLSATFEQPNSPPRNVVLESNRVSMIQVLL